MPFLNFLLDLFFPRRCLGCGTSETYLCSACFPKIKFIDSFICPVCEKPSFNGAAHPKCQTRYNLDGLISVCVYEGLIKKAIHLFKYKRVFDLSETLIGLFEKYLETNSSLGLLFKEMKKENYLVVPVPLHFVRENFRGFNQAGIMGKILAKRHCFIFRENWLIREKYTFPQVKLKGEKRRKNVREAFGIKKEAAGTLKGKNIILIDDVWTTGSTLRTCANILKRNGAGKIWGLTLAR